jgi:spermidine synthase
MTTWSSLKRWTPLFLISGLALFFELALIRWIAAEVRLLSYFKNLPLLAAFLGLSLGYAFVHKGRDYRPTFAPVLLVLVLAVILVGRMLSPLGLAYPGSADEALWYIADLPHWIALILFLSTVLIFFLLTMFVFIPLGQATGAEMTHHAPVPAYIVNIVASLVGIWFFALLSYWQTPPVLWFGLGLAGLSAYLAYRQAFSKKTLAFFAVSIILLGVSGFNEIWSPYQRLEISDLYLPRRNTGELVKIGSTLNIQQVFYQRAIDLSDQKLAELNGDIPELDDMAFSYNLPYRLGPVNAAVLIVGAGMGNDVAGALRSPARTIDAVEIDPQILALGYQLHPEKPYANARVHTIVDDARSFLKSSDKRYDVISFGLLDSHTLLSGLSNVRLDSFVYTLESFQQVRDHLNPGGFAVVTFAGVSDAQWIEQRLGRMLEQVFGEDAVYAHYGKLGVTFVAGAVTPEQVQTLQLAAWQPDQAGSDIPLSTDDWPYLYLRLRQIPAAYWQVLILIGAVCLVLIGRSFRAALRPDWHFWLLGAAFLLVEFKSITEFALLFGTTWLVNALAISGVLLMVLAANLVVLRRRRVSLTWAYVLLFISLVFSFFFPLDTLTALPPLPRAIASMVLLSLPLFFSSMIFSEAMRRHGEATGPLSSNLFGSVAGGIMEYASLWWGIKSLYILATAVYLGAWLVWRRQNK